MPKRPLASKKKSPARAKKKPARRAKKLASKKTAAKKPAAKKPAAKKPAAKRPAKKPARKRPATKPRVAKKPAAKKKPAKKPRVAKKPAAKKKPARKPRRSSRVTHLAALEEEMRTAKSTNREEATALIADILRRKKRIAEDFHAIGVALQRLSEERLYQALGYSSFTDLLKAKRLIGTTTAYRLMAIAGAYPAKMAHGLGIEKAYQLIAYAEATPAPDLARTLAVANPRIGNQRLDRMSSRDLIAAARRVRSAAGTATKKSSFERAARRAAREVQRALRAKGAKTAKARAVRLDARWRVRIDIAVDDTEHVA